MNVPGTFFECNLNLELKLEIEGDSVTVFSCHIEDVSLDLQSYGFNSTVQLISFGNSELDKLFSPSHVSKITKAELSFKHVSEKQTDPLLELKGLVTKKSLKRIDRIGDKEQSRRIYEITFSDYAAAEWGEHFPTNIYVDQTMKFVIEEHKTADISIDYSFPPLEKTHPILAFSLPYQHGVSAEEQITFYSFLMWYLQRENGIWAYDYHSYGYSLSDKKEAEGEPFKIFEDYVLPPTYIFPETLRYNVKTVKHSPVLADIDTLVVKDAFDAIRKDVLEPLNPACFLDLCHDKIKSHVYSKEAEVRVQVVQFFEDFHLDKLIPGALLGFRGNPKEKSWTSDDFYKDQVFRSRSLRLRSYKLDTSEPSVSAIEPYRLSVTVLLEQKTEIFVERPAFIPPVFPFSIHGSIFSDIGDPKQTTYKIIQADNGSQLYYLVTVPLAGEDKKLIVPFVPDFMTGQYYFPFCKGEKVVLSMYFQCAKIERVLDWQPLARLPQGVQAGQIVLASDGEDKYSIIRHEFEDLKRSVFTIQQSSSADQSQTIQIQEKDITVAVQEKEKKEVIIKLNRDTGLTLIVKDSESEVTQEVFLDGKVLVLKCTEDGVIKSTYEQTPTSITVSCAKFNVSATEINLSAKDNLTVCGKKSLTAQSDIVVGINATTTNINSSEVKMGKTGEEKKVVDQTASIDPTVIAKILAFAKLGVTSYDNFRRLEVDDDSSSGNKSGS
jgi:hypothetical protein